MSNDVYIQGIDMIKFGRFPNLSVPELAAESILLALNDANLNMGQIEAFYCGNIKEVNRMVGQKTLQLIGQTGIPIVNCTNACATGATAFREGWMSIKAGLYEMKAVYPLKGCLDLKQCQQFLLKLEWSIQGIMELLLNNLQKYL
jgi:acetyl-CoA acyltransferase